MPSEDVIKRLVNGCGMILGEPIPPTPSPSTPSKAIAEKKDRVNSPNVYQVENLIRGSYMLKLSVSSGERMKPNLLSTAGASGKHWRYDLTTALTATLAYESSGEPSASIQSASQPRFLSWRAIVIVASYMMGRR
jgi:hypothetical protein